MSQSDETLDAVVSDIESKADDYDEVEHYETKKRDFLNSLSSVESSLGRLERRIESMEFLAGVLTEVHDEALPVGGEVESARNSIRSTLDRDRDDFYDLVAEGREDQYEQKVEQSMKKVSTANDALEANLREVQDEWVESVETARSVQKLVGGSREMSETLGEIEQFVTRRMWDESEDLSTLEFVWENLMEKWDEGEGVDWGTFQDEHNMRDETIDVLKRLASEGEIKLGELNEVIVEDMLSVGPLRSVVKLSI
jgi:hypothetical protein